MRRERKRRRRRWWWWRKRRKGRTYSVDNTFCEATFCREHFLYSIENTHCI